MLDLPDNCLEAFYLYDHPATRARRDGGTASKIGSQEPEPALIYLTDHAPRTAGRRDDRQKKPPSRNSGEKKGCANLTNNQPTRDRDASPQ